MKNKRVDELCCDVDVASILTVRLAAVLAAHWHRLPSIGAWGIAMLADISESANVSASTEAGMKTTLKTLQAKSKQPGQGGLMKMFATGSGGTPRATQLLNRCNQWSLLLSKLAVFEGQVRDIMVDHWKKSDILWIPDPAKLHDGIAKLSLEAVASSAAVLSKFIAKQFADTKKPPATSDHLNVLNLLVAGEDGCTADGIKLCADLPFTLQLCASLGASVLAWLKEYLFDTAKPSSVRKIFEVVDELLKEYKDKVEANDHGLEFADEATVLKADFDITSVSSKVDLSQCAFRDDAVNQHNLFFTFYLCLCVSDLVETSIVRNLYCPFEQMSHFRF